MIVAWKFLKYTILLWRGKVVVLYKFSISSVAQMYKIRWSILVCYKSSLEVPRLKNDHLMLYKVTKGDFSLGVQSPTVLCKLSMGGQGSITCELCKSSQKVAFRTIGSLRGKNKFGICCTFLKKFRNILFPGFWPFLSNDV